jgi:hypothetical protein
MTKIIHGEAKIYQTQGALGRFEKLIKSLKKDKFEIIEQKSEYHDQDPEINHEGITLEVKYQKEVSV